MSNVDYKSDQVFLYWDDQLITNSKDNSDAATNSEQQRDEK